MDNNSLIFGKPEISEKEISEVVSCLKSGWVGTGPRTLKFEKMFQGFKGIEHAAALNSCTAAIHLALIAVGIKTGDEVIVPAMTFVATANAVIHAGGIPVFADVDKRTMNLDVRDMETRLTPRTKALIPVHFAGRPSDMHAIMAVAEKKGLKVIEDCAHAIEAEYHGKKIGTMGDVGCFSFYATKNIATGEGGMAVSDNAEYINKIKLMSLHGINTTAWERTGDEGYTHYEMECPGYKFNMTDLSASLGIHQLSDIYEKYDKRSRIWDKYNEAFKDLPVFTPLPIEENTRHAFHLYTLLLDTDRTNITRDAFLLEMRKRKIGIGVHYRALHYHKYFRDTFGYRTGDFPRAEWISERTISLPLSPFLSDEEVCLVISSVREVLQRK